MKNNTIRKIRRLKCLFFVISGVDIIAILWISAYTIDKSLETEVEITLEYVNDKKIIIPVILITFGLFTVINVYKTRLLIFVLS